jgi:hypothetical protein
MDTNLTRASFSNDITWREAVDDFLLHIRAIREEGTEKFYRDRLKHLVKWADANGITVQGFHACWTGMSFPTQLGIAPIHSLRGNDVKQASRPR